MNGLITEAISYWATETPDRPALVFDGVDVVDYAALDRWTARAASWLSARGLNPGDRVGVIGANSLEWCAAAIGALKAGGVVAPYNNRFTVPELGHLIADSDPVYVISDAATSDRVTEALAGTDIALLHLEDFTALRESDDAAEISANRNSDEAAIIIYTSGSTAAPKGVVYTHRTMFNFIAELAISETAFHPGAGIIYTLSMSGAPGLPWHILHPLSRGMTVFYEKGFDAKAALTRLCNERIEIMSGVPVQFEQIAALPEFEHADLSGLQLCTIAGARVPLPTLRAWLAKGVPLRQAYGMTELSGLTSINPASEAVNRPGSIGRGTVFTRHRVVRPDSVDCDPGEPGEIIVKGPGIAAGYWRNDEATAALVRDGWLHTGDVGVRDAEGFIAVVDRMKDLIISGGYNIAPSEIEATISEMPGIAEVCVIAAPDVKFGETPAAIVYGEESLTAQSVVAWCADRLAPYKVPRYVIVEQDPLPRMVSGKIARRDIRQRYAEISARTPRLR